MSASTARVASPLPSTDQASFQAGKLIAWCDDRMYLRPTQVLEVQGDPISVLARVAQKLPEMTDMGPDSYDALLARLTESVTEFSASMTSGFLSCTITYQDEAKDIAGTTKDGETRQFIAFTADGQVVDTGIQGRDRHLTLGGGGYKTDDMSQFQNALSDRKHIMVQLQAKTARDSVAAEQGGLSHDMIAPVLQQLQNEPQTLRKMAHDIAQQERFPASNDIASAAFQNYLPEPVAQALNTLAQAGQIAPASVEAFIAPQQPQAPAQMEIRVEMTAPQQQPIVTQPEAVKQAEPSVAPQAPQQIQAQTKPEQEQQPVTIAMTIATPQAAPVVFAPSMGGSSSSSAAPRAESSSYQSPKAAEISSAAPAAPEQPKAAEPAKVEEPKKPDAQKTEEKPSAPVAAPVIQKPAEIVIKGPEREIAIPVPSAPLTSSFIAATPRIEVSAPPQAEAPRQTEVIKQEQPKAETPVQQQSVQPVAQQAPQIQPQAEQPKQAAPQQTVVAEPVVEAAPRRIAEDNVVPFQQPRNEDRSWTSPKTQSWDVVTPTNVTQKQTIHEIRHQDFSGGPKVYEPTKTITHIQTPPTKSFNGCAECNFGRNCGACPIMATANKLASFKP